MARWAFIGVVIVAFAAAALMWEAPKAMGKTATIFSEINATLVNAAGEPQSGVKIERWWRRTPEAEPESDTTTTAEDGSFHFPEITYKPGFMGRLPGTPAYKQRITAIGPDGEVKLWFHVKTSNDPNSELDGRPARLVCRIDREPDAEGPVFGTCRIAD